MAWNHSSQDYTLTETSLESGKQEFLKGRTHGGFGLYDYQGPTEADHKPLVQIAFMTGPEGDYVFTIIQEERENKPNATVTCSICISGTGITSRTLEAIAEQASTAFEKHEAIKVIE